MMDDESAPQDAGPYVPPWEFGGHDLSRILSLSDGVFGFALTLLVLSIALPAAGGRPLPGAATELGDLTPAFTAYALGFLVIFSYWRLHHLAFSYFRRWDRTLVQLNGLLLALVALQPFLVTFITVYPANRTTVIFFASISALTGATLLAIWTYASRDRRLLAPKIDLEGIRYVRGSLVTIPALFLVSIAIAFVSPTLAEYSWVLALVVNVAFVRRARARRYRGNGRRAGIPGRSPSPVTEGRGDPADPYPLP